MALAPLLSDNRSAGLESMEFRYPKAMPFLGLVLAAGCVLTALLGEASGRNGSHQGFQLAVAVLAALAFSLYTFRFAVRINSETLSVSSWSIRSFRLSELTSVENISFFPFFGQFTRFVAVGFADSRKLVFVSHLAEFDRLEALLRGRARLNASVEIPRGESA